MRQGDYVAQFPDEFKIEAVKQITERGCSVAEVSKRLGVCCHSLYAWKKRYDRPRADAKASDAQAAEIRRLKQELARVTEECDIGQIFLFVPCAGACPC
jgi:transposase